MLLRFGIVILGLSFFLPPAFAQDYGNRQQQNIAKEDIKANGVLKGIRNGQLYVLADDGGQWVVNIERNAQRLGYVGTADAQWLRAGMFVEFNATVNAKGETTIPVKQANIITPTKENPAGVSGDSGGKSEDFFGVKEESEKPKEVTMKVRAVGQITGVKDGVAAVNCGNGTVLAAFDPEARISIDLPGAAGLQLARVGDKIEFVGWYVQNNKGQAWASSVHVSGSEVYTGKSPMKPVKGRPMKPMAEKPAEAAEKPAEEK